ncbi:Putative uncharacterized protein [Mycobacterium tuberculosis variant bovis]|uniref:Uncharacterized protein n=3 Tax=Mycobacterium tuberculosis TaxID=1773 RepID=Q8VIV9_MYCTO|nr:hypothetical protein MT3767.2 [Mycobacterium tuberculosis CDC1551]ABR08022.1 hypothetical protein TBFG_13697 [Mycobacterium tuberculosis F11]AEB05861.1 conserved hypothetical protein [Mycobacterium tuberculosis KZN 4207]AGL25205.1 hypothetical protein I917_25670 [Mycobacterium tuberculosis str. Haarlem/NITR202]APR58922.1 hypothetical protein BTU11_20115 [Mycobacterium tuberculosis]EAY61231.1 hypothetical protein TBCG_03589 [Mycobacterium tuberculosis C]EFD15421.1 conserved hypothetical pro
MLPLGLPPSWPSGAPTRSAAPIKLTGANERRHIAHVAHASRSPLPATVTVSTTRHNASRTLQGRPTCDV